MLSKPKLMYILFVALMSFAMYAECCEVNEWQYGCRIYNRQCSCGVGCPAEYRYESSAECISVLRGVKQDICSKKNPCLNGGSCLQVLSDMKFKCLCQGTGYYGTRCEKLCPRPNDVHTPGSLPYECVII